MTYSVNGQPVHLAARMEQLAMPGTILMASQTFHLTRGLSGNQGAGPDGGEGAGGARRDLRAARSQSPCGRGSRWPQPAD